ncbi:hypothetical protein Peur_016884 [Populus x canadensis]
MAIALWFGIFQDNSFRSRLVAARDRGFNYSSLTSRDPSRIRRRYGFIPVGIAPLL